MWTGATITASKTSCNVQGQGLKHVEPEPWTHQPSSDDDLASRGQQWGIPEWRVCCALFMFYLMISIFQNQQEPCVVVQVEVPQLPYVSRQLCPPRKQRFTLKCQSQRIISVKSCKASNLRSTQACGRVKINSISPFGYFNNCMPEHSKARSINVSTQEAQAVLQSISKHRLCI